MTPIDIFGEDAGFMFWDVHIDSVNLFYDYEFVILRVLQRNGNNLEVLQKLDNAYPKNVVLEVLREKQELINSVEDFEGISKFYNLDPNEFSKYRYFMKFVVKDEIHS